MAAAGLLPSAAYADGFTFGGAHAAYAVGPAVGDRPGGRQGFDLGAVGAYGPPSNGDSSGMPARSDVLLFGANALLGFGKYPSYVGGEFGIGGDNGFTGGFATVGPVARLDPTPGAGAAVRLGGDAMLLEVTLHLIAVLVPDRDLVFAFTFGLGRF